MAELKRSNPKALETLNLRLKELDGLQLKAGWFEGNKYESGTPVALAAAASEYGVPSRSIPPRPFVRPTIAEKKQPWMEIAARGAKAILNGKETPESVLSILGHAVTGDIQQTITQIHAPPLSPITLWLRNWKRENPDKTVGGRIVGEAARATAKSGYTGPAVSEKPLIETNRLLTSITSIVEKSS